METRWGFKTNKEVKERTSSFPEVILKEEFNKLSELTEDEMYGKCMSIPIENAKEIIVCMKLQQYVMLLCQN